jgi:PBP1b-binding outer membrane lipoprotein LpoB
MKKILLILIIPILFNSCSTENEVEMKIKKYYSDKLHDPSSFEIVKIKEIKKIYTIDGVYESLEQSRMLLESFSKGLKYNPNSKFSLENVKKYTLEIESYENEIDSMRNGFLNNNIENLDIYFSYRAKNTFGALILADAVAKMTYLESNDNYGSIYSITETDSQK